MAGERGQWGDSERRSWAAEGSSSERHGGSLTFVYTGVVMFMLSRLSFAPKMYPARVLNPSPVVASELDVPV